MDDAGGQQLFLTHLDVRGTKRRQSGDRHMAWRPVPVQSPLPEWQRQHMERFTPHGPSASATVTLLADKASGSGGDPPPPGTVHGATMTSPGAVPSCFGHHQRRIHRRHLDGLGGVGHLRLQEHRHRNVHGVVADVGGQRCHRLVDGRRDGDDA